LAIFDKDPRAACAGKYLITYAFDLTIGATSTAAIDTVRIVVITAVIGTGPSILHAIVIAVSGIVITTTAITLVCAEVTVVALATTGLATKARTSLIGSGFAIVIAIEIVIQPALCAVLGVHTAIVSG
jgi:hypothetical protein